MRSIQKMLVVPSFALFALTATMAGAEDDFGYSCQTCPAAWPDLNILDNNCGGPTQSPIAFSDGDAEFDRSPRLRVRYRDTLVTEEIKSTNVEYADDESGNSLLRFGRTHYTLAQFHFHTTAEHVVNGERSALEMHFVNKAADGSALVLAAFIDEGRHNPAFDPIVEAINGDDVTQVDTIEVELDHLLPRKLVDFRYVGSTTTPPCSPDVQWILLREHVELSEDQIATIQAAVRDGLNDGFDNNRPIQNRELRLITTNVRGDRR